MNPNAARPQSTPSAPGPVPYGMGPLPSVDPRHGVDTEAPAALHKYLLEWQMRFGLSSAETLHYLAQVTGAVSRFVLQIERRLAHESQQYGGHPNAPQTGGGPSGGGAPAG